MQKRYFGILIGFSIFFVLGILSLSSPRKIESGDLSPISVTMSNSRLSYKSSIGTGQSVGDTTITIDADSADPDTDHLFPGDTICFVNAAQSGCIGNRTYTVDSIVTAENGTQFTMTDGLDNALVDTDFVVATSSGTLAVTFTTTGEIPANGDILITIPAVQTANKTCDGIPDTATLANNGFDLKNPALLAAGDISTTVAEETDCLIADWVTTEVITCATGANDHTIRINRQNTSCATGETITVTIGGTNKPINPAPRTGHSQFSADAYSIRVQTRGGSDEEIDISDAMVGPVEAVFVSATVEETLTFTIAGVGSGSTHCNADGFSTDVATYAFAVPFGSIASTDTFYEAEQQLTVSTNADGGYKVYVTENDELSKDGAGVTVIPDTPCDSGPCTHTTAQDWITEDTYHGFGYSLANASNSDAKFLYSDGSWNAKQFPNESETAGQYDDTNAEVMTNSDPVDGSSVYVCYRLTVSGTQSAGYYYNKIWYIATPTF